MRSGSARSHAAQREPIVARAVEAPAAAGRPAHAWLAGAAACGAAYLYGSLPVVYLLGRWRRVDLQHAGSWNVGATNLLAGGTPALSVAGWLFDASKGLLPIAVARGMGLDEASARLAGVCGVAGQCWPIFLRYNGGRGISAFVGASAVMTDPAAWAASLAPLAAGGLWRVASTGRTRDHPRRARSKSVPLGCLVGVVLFPLVSGARDHGASRGTRLAPWLLAAMLLLRRLTAPLSDDATRGPCVRPVALLYRLLYDRNTSE